MDVVADTWGKADAFAAAHMSELVLGAVVLAVVALFLALWSLVRRRGVRRLRRQVMLLDQRVRRLELADERQQTVAAIRLPVAGMESV